MGCRWERRSAGSKIQGRTENSKAAPGRREGVNHYCDVWFWRGLGQAEEARHFTDRVRMNGEPGKPRHAGLVRRFVLPLLRMVGLAEQPADTPPVVEQEAKREGCSCGRGDEFENREPIMDDDGEWALRCPECGHLDHLLWLSDEARALVLGLARRRWRLRLRRAVSS